jgi:hypothetical protein
MDKNSNSIPVNNIGSAHLMMRSAVRLRLSAMPRCAVAAFIGGRPKSFLWFCSALRSTGYLPLKILHADAPQKLTKIISNQTTGFFFVNDTSNQEFKSCMNVEIARNIWPNIYIIVLTNNLSFERRMILLRSGANIVVNEDDCSPTAIACAISACMASCQTACITMVSDRVTAGNDSTNHRIRWSIDEQQLADA